MVILDRLDELGAGLLPEDPKARAEAQLFEELADTLINGFVVASRWADERNWPRAREAWVGDEVTVADVALFGQLHSLRLPMTEWQAEVLSRHERLSLYLDRVHEATAFRSHDSDS